MPVVLAAKQCGLSTPQETTKTVPKGHEDRKGERRKSKIYTGKRQTDRRNEKKTKDPFDLLDKSLNELLT